MACNRQVSPERCWNNVLIIFHGFSEDNNKTLKKKKNLAHPNSIPSEKQSNLTDRLSIKRHKIVSGRLFPEFFQYLNSAGARTIQPILYSEKISFPFPNINKHKVKDNVSYAKIPLGTILKTKNVMRLHFKQFNNSP